MNLLKNNPLGMTLTSVSGVFALLALVMTIGWFIPVAVETAVAEESQQKESQQKESKENSSNQPILTAHPLAELNDFQVINERPVFNVSRQPVEEEDDGEVVEELVVAVKDAPDVRLTGVVITPSMKIASLTPANGKLEAVTAHEGESLTGEYVGWQIGMIKPRSVVLESSDGRKLELDLEVHDSTIKQPPKTAAPANTEQTRPGEKEGVISENDQPLSRAEQIRQRIAERREELRLEQEQTQSEADNQTEEPQSYQSAIRSMMKPKPQDQDNNDKKDG